MPSQGFFIAFLGVHMAPCSHASFRWKACWKVSGFEDVSQGDSCRRVIPGGDARSPVMSTIIYNLPHRRSN